ncbi:hypothetical protein [Dyadobacter psychrophilus]|uniref:Uncharacterized protein n=1 Tax=Dyadobacter psychrophilus TaxID=651661 RepID=A0A1T5HFZ7_9BACT|nr:hypothetical protein [Dyadobacter psychrophilus]SKC19582.1 hypothetical protein SAMN05660293_05489 [Dyadobacter psychrophilus]
MENQYIIKFEDVVAKDANQYASELTTLIRSLGEDIQVEQTRDNARTQDAGATVLLILGTPAALALARGIAKGIQAILTKYRDTRIVIEGPNGMKLDVKGFTGLQAIDITEKFLRNGHTEV